MFYHPRDWNKSFESIEVLIYDYDTGLLISWLVLYISPKLLAMGIEGIEYAEKYMSEIKITFDYIVILRKRRKSIKRELILLY